MTTRPPPEGSSLLARLWARFRSAPLGGQAIGWLLLAPVLAALFLVGDRRPSGARYLGAAAVILLLGPVWFAVASDLAGSVTGDVAGSTADADAGWRVTNIVDGDTIDVRHADGTEERVRIVGIDTPERGECAFGEASVALADLVMGEQVTLLAGARDDRDRYDRILRYVDVGDTDAGLELIKLGLATARYDSRDGFGEHPREDEYVGADEAMENISCGPETASTPAAGASRDVIAFSTCAALNEVYPGGVARTGVEGNLVDGSLRPFGRTPYVDDALYAANTGRDGDEDGIACER